eukprot:s1502_g23.t1
MFARAMRPGYLALSRFAKLQAKVPSRAALALSAGALGAGALTAKSWVQPVGCEGPNWEAIRKEIVNILEDDKYKETCLQQAVFHTPVSVLVVNWGAIDSSYFVYGIWTRPRRLGNILFFLNTEIGHKVLSCNSLYSTLGLQLQLCSESARLL